MVVIIPIGRSARQLLDSVGTPRKGVLISPLEREVPGDLRDKMCNLVDGIGKEPEKDFRLLGVAGGIDQLIRRNFLDFIQMDKSTPNPARGDIIELNQGQRLPDDLQALFEAR